MYAWNGGSEKPENKKNPSLMRNWGKDVLSLDSWDLNLIFYSSLKELRYGNYWAYSSDHWRQVRYKVIEDYNGACCPLNRGVRTFFTSPCTEDPQIRLQKGEFILATRGLWYWLYGDKILDDSFIEGTSRVRGWFPRNCVEKCPCDSDSDPAPEGEKNR